MRRQELGRRLFLKKTGQALASSSLISVLPLNLEAQSSAKSTTHQGTSRPQATVRLNVKDLGALGDGTTNDTLAIQQTLDRCNLLGGGEVLVPAGQYLTGALVLRSNVVLRLDEQASLLGSPDLKDYPLSQVRWEGKWVKGYVALISAVEAENVVIAGKGKIVGSTGIKGRLDRKTGWRNPALLEFTSCKNVRVEDCFTIQNDMWSIHPVYCENVTLKNLTVHGGADGIDVDSCKEVVIADCEFSTADDCISLKSGRGEEGYSILRPTENVQISGCTFSDSRWACIGIGSETSGGIRDVRVEHCKFLGARTYAIYIKSRPGRGAFIENIAVNDIDVSGAQQGFLRINILNSGKQDEFPVPGSEGIPTIRNFHFSNVRVDNVPVLVEGTEISPAKPLDGFSLVNVSGTCAKGISLANMRRVVLKDIKVTGFSGPLLSTYNVTGTGLNGAAALQATKVPDDIPAPAQPYSLH